MTNGKHILIIDDDFEIRSTLAELLEDEGYIVRLAPNGREALAELRRGPLPHLILLDLMMPVMNGWQFRREQQGDPALRDVPVVVISASSMVPTGVPPIDTGQRSGAPSTDGGRNGVLFPDSAQRSGAPFIGAAGVLKKPIDLDTLLETIHACCA